MNLTQAIAKLLWPREMLELIDKHRADGTLNEGAVDWFARAMWVRFIISFVLSVIFLSTEEVWLGVSLLLATPIFVAWDLRSLFRHQMAVYLFGTKVEARARYAGVSIFGTQRIWCHYGDKPVKVFMGEKPKLEREDIPHSGDSIRLYYDPEAKYGAMPDVDYLKAKWCLSK